MRSQFLRKRTCKLIFSVKKHERDEINSNPHSDFSNVYKDSHASVWDENFNDWLPPMSITKYLEPGHVNTLDTSVSPFSSVKSLIFLSWQKIAATSGSNASFNCSGLLSEAIPAFKKQKITTAFTKVFALVETGVDFSCSNVSQNTLIQLFEFRLNKII